MIYAGALAAMLSHRLSANGSPRLTEDADEPRRNYPAHH